jgi:predicted phage terminase large subunit-like protein
MASASEILAQRLKVRSDLVAWCRHAGYEPARHHRLILRHLKDVADGRCDRLAVTTSPGAAKSTYLQLFAAWWLANNPTAAGSIVVSSHTQALADRASIRIRSLVAEHSAVLGIALDERTTAAERWALQSGAEVRKVGSGTAVTGYRCSLALCDDNVKGIEQASSLSEMEKLYAWFRADLSTRLVPSGRIVILQTRWSTFDLLGRLLDEEPDRWTLLSLPAYAEADDPLGRAIGDPLWADDPVYNYPAFIAEQKRALPPRMFVSLFQQAPVAAEGNLIKTEWLKTYAVHPDPATCRRYIAFDLATTEAAGDYSAIVTLSIDPLGDWFITDVWRKQTTIDKTIDALLDRVRDFKPLCVATESGGLRNASLPFLKARMMERNIYVQVESITSTKSKEIRAQSFVGRIATRGLYLPQQSLWLSDFVTEMLAFPSAGRTDDQVDCMSLLGALVDKLAPGEAPLKKEPPAVISTDPNSCTLTLTQLFEDNERHGKRGGARIC